MKTFFKKGETVNPIQSGSNAGERLALFLKKAARLPQGGRTFFTHRRKAVVANPSGRARPLTRFDQADRGYSPGRAARGEFYDGTTSGANVSGHGAGVSTFGKFAEGDPERMAA
jgi:hypothetical protein